METENREGSDVISAKTFSLYEKLLFHKPLPAHRVPGSLLGDWPEEPPLLPLQKFGERSRQRVFGGRAAANTPVWRRHDPSPAWLFI